jgi:hypothetical protein
MEYKNDSNLYLLAKHNDSKTESIAVMLYPYEIKITLFQDIKTFLFVKTRRHEKKNAHSTKIAMTTKSALVHLGGIKQSQCNVL